MLLGCRWARGRSLCLSINRQPQCVCTDGIRLTCHAGRRGRQSRRIVVRHAFQKVMELGRGVHGVGIPDLVFAEIWKSVCTVIWRKRRRHFVLQTVCVCYCHHIAHLTKYSGWTLIREAGSNEGQRFTITQRPCGKRVMCVVRVKNRTSPQLHCRPYLLYGAVLLGVLLALPPPPFFIKLRKYSSNFSTGTSDFPDPEVGVATDVALPSRCSSRLGCLGVTTRCGCIGVLTPPGLAPRSAPASACC